jgi:hypothetical protein
LADNIDAAAVAEEQQVPVPLEGFDFLLNAIWLEKIDRSQQTLSFGALLTPFEHGVGESTYTVV